MSNGELTRSPSTCGCCSCGDACKGKLDDIAGIVNLARRTLEMPHPLTRTCRGIYPLTRSVLSDAAAIAAPPALSQQRAVL